MQYGGRGWRAGDGSKRYYQYREIDEQQHFAAGRAIAKEKQGEVKEIRDKLNKMSRNKAADGNGVVAELMKQVANCLSKSLLRYSLVFSHQTACHQRIGRKLV